MGIVAVLLTFLSVQKGFIADDYFQRVILLYKGSRSLSYAMHNNFTVLTPNLTKSLIYNGILPWWTSPNLTLSFFRPISALTNWIDYQLWENLPQLMHAQTIFWYALLCVFVAVFYRKLIRSAPIAGLAAFFFTVDVNHLTPVIWLADRDRLIVVLFGVIALLFHNLSRIKKSYLFGFLAMLFFLLTLLVAELGIIIMSYLISYVIFFESSRFRSRLQTLLPYLIVIFGWLIVYRSQGYGVSATNLYIDPTKDFIRFILQALIRTPVLLVEQLFNPSMLLPSYTWGFFGGSFYNILSPVARFLYLILCVIICSVIVFLYAPIIRKDRTTRFFLIGAILSAFFSSSTSILNGRLLNFTGLGVFIILSQIFVDMFRSSVFPIQNARKFASFLLISILFFIHAILSPIQFFIYASGPNSWQEDIINKTTTSSDKKMLSDNEVVVINAPSGAYFALAPSIRLFTKQFSVEHLHILALGYQTLKVSRSDNFSIQIDSKDGLIPDSNERLNVTSRIFPLIHQAYFYQDLEETLYQLPYQPTNTMFKTDQLNIQIVKLTPDGRPKSAVFTFTKPLGNRSLMWYWWDWKKKQYRRFSVPSVGNSIYITGPF